MGLSCFKSWKHDSTGHKGNRDVLASPGSYFFLSNSAGQGDEWLKSLNKGVWIPFTGVFGQSLEETVLYERRYGVRLVPLVVEQCVTFIRERGLHEVGLFRQSGQASLVKELQEAFDAGERPSFDSSTDVHTVASLLKLYLRQLPEPLVPYSRYQEFLLCGQKLLSDRTLGLGELRNLLRELPVANFNLLNFICQFLNEVQSYSSSNKMSGQNLATVFGPNILRAKAEDPQSIVGGAALVQVLMLELIREHASLFAKVPPSISVRPPGGSRASPSALRHPHLHPSPCLRQLSLPLIAERSREAGQPATDSQDPSCIYSAAGKSDLSSGQKRHLGHRYTSSHPENCFYPLPSSSQPIQHHSGQANIDYHQHHAGQGPFPANIQASTTSLQLQDPLSDCSKPKPGLMGWGKAWPGPRESGAGYWSSSAAEEGAVPENASGGSSDAHEDSALSAYDNLDRVSLGQRMEDITGEHLETNDPESHAGNCEEEGELEEARQTMDSSSSWSSCDILPLDESADATFQEPEPQSQARDAHSLLAELRQQMAQQKAEYQARIQSLEQQKRSQSVAEIKIRNMERAKADADFRNSTLQREMEMFFQMYGEFRRKGRDEGGRSGESL
ncbi:Rho GTPase-activating protein 24 [Collichthys lucidus]|uniref:Rho GTPase-activating protein 24 n=1 Tax=Collichthys lucidus TaxID=240159 RepID=A0A4U5V715_COLLU|nr:Rho GTPase-activating protein 24 [Collichthys lucidus]